MINIKEFTKSFFDSRPAAKADWERVYKSMIIHTRGVKPVELLNIKRPNEPEDIRNYRLANYRPITKHGINQAIDSVYRILSGSNYVISYTSNTAEYLNNAMFRFMGERLSFKQLFFRHILRLMFDDPNGLLVWLPENAENQNLLPIANPPNAPINVRPVYVQSPKIMHYRDDVIAFEADDKWSVTVPYGNKTKDVLKEYYYIISEHYIWRFIPYWNAEEKKIMYRTEDFYNLSLEDGMPNGQKLFPSLVGKMLGGNIALNENGASYYDSFFGAYVPFADDAICAYSDNQAVRVRYNFPFTSVKGQLCGTCRGAGKTVDKDGKKIICSSCDGCGKTIPFTPFGHYIKEPPGASDSEAFVASPAVEFYSPDVAILENSYRTWEDLLEKAEDAVNMLFIKEAQSGVAKERDREEKYETLIKISNNFFELIEWSLDIIEAYREPFVDERQRPIVRAPMSLHVSTASQLLEELAGMTQSEVPSAYIAATAMRLSEKLFDEDDKIKNILKILTVWDPLFGKSSQQIAALRAAGGATADDVRRHVLGYSILAMLADEIDFNTIEISNIISLAEERLRQNMSQQVLIFDDEQQI